MTIFIVLDQNCLLKANQSGFRPGGSCIHQLIAITHNIFTAFDAKFYRKLWYFSVFFWIYPKPLIEFGIKV